MARVAPGESARDTIVARATAPGDGAIAIVRMSGPDARRIAEKTFTPLQSSPLAPGSLALGRLHAPESGDVIDEGFLVQWRAPRSYTGEDMAEYQIHGSSIVVARVIEACVRAGARVARPGEFTRRAYLNGKLDLAQAEAVCDLIRAQTEASGRAALSQLAGGLSRRIAELRGRLVPVLAELEAIIDFPEEGLEFSTRQRLGTAIDGVSRDLRTLVDSARRGFFLREGARVVLAGPPNAGKSSLFNLLVGRERALVTPHPGTTRDTIEASVDLGGIPLTIVDTAGLRETPEEIEAMGILRTREELASADLVVFMVDCTRPDEARGEWAGTPQSPRIVVANKADLADQSRIAGIEQAYRGEGRVGFVALSTATRTGLEEFEALLLRHFSGGATAASEGGIVTNRRHAAALERSVKALETSAEGLASELSPEFIAVDLTEAIAALDSISGRQSLDEDVLDAIFSTFCLGK